MIHLHNLLPICLSALEGISSTLLAHVDNFQPPLVNLEPGEGAGTDSEYGLEPVEGAGTDSEYDLKLRIGRGLR